MARKICRTQKPIFLCFPYRNSTKKTNLEVFGAIPVKLVFTAVFANTKRSSQILFNMKHAFE